MLEANNQSPAKPQKGGTCERVLYTMALAVFRGKGEGQTHVPDMRGGFLLWRAKIKIRTRGPVKKPTKANPVGVEERSRWV